MAVLATGRFAKTDFKVLKRFSNHTYLEIYPRTGRTHQIRVHLAKIGYPVLGDKVYFKGEPLDRPGRAEAARESRGKGPQTARHMLHAYQITVEHPATKKPIIFTAPIPKDFLRVLKELSR